MPTPEPEPQTGAPAGQVAAGATTTPVPAVSPEDRRSGLVKAHRALSRCLPPDLPERAKVLQIVLAAIDTLGPAPEHRVCRRCGTAFTFSIERQAAYAVKQWAAPRHCRKCRVARDAERQHAGAAAHVPEDGDGDGRDD